MLRFVPQLACAVAAATVALGVAVATAQPDGVEHAKQQLEPYRKLPEFVPPGPPFDAKACMAGKTILSIPVSSANPFTKNIEQAMAQVADEIGFEFIEWENQGQPSQWVQGMNHAVNQQVDLIDLLGGADPKVLAPQVQQARDAGIEVVASHYSGFEQKLPEGVGAVPIDYLTAGKLLADWAIMQTGGKANALVITSTEVFSTESMVNGITQEFEEYCPDCKFRFVNVPVPDWSTRIQPNVQSAILADPTLNYIIPIYDSMSQFVVPAITITGAGDRVKIATFNGTPFVLGLIQQGQVEMDIGENLDWIGHAVMDAEMRVLCGLEPIEDPKIPFYIFDENNAHTAGSPPQLSTGYGEAYIKGYRELWGLDG